MFVFSGITFVGFMSLQLYACTLFISVAWTIVVFKFIAFVRFASAEITWAPSCTDLAIFPSFASCLILLIKIINITSANIPNPMNIRSRVSLLMSQLFILHSAIIDSISTVHKTVEIILYM